MGYHKKSAADFTTAELTAWKEELSAEYAAYRASGTKLDLSRGKPETGQLDISNGLLTALSGEGDYRSAAGFDCRNYGIVDGLPEMKRIFSDLLGIPAENIIVGGNSSLNLMYDAIARFMIYGVLGQTPWAKLERVRFLCPAPGYDRHFAILESMGIEMIPVALSDSGPDMDAVERLAAADESIKGIFCVPKYSNPTGITYSDETVTRLAALPAMAKDFVIMWDNAYALHDLYGEGDKLLDILSESAKYGNENRVLYFTSTSKITLPGAGVSMVASGSRMIAAIRQIMGIQTIGHDKINQLRHVRYLKDADHVRKIMQKHAAVLRPKFDLALRVLSERLGGLGIAEWTTPRGGYFISLDTMDGCAARVFGLMKEAGVTLTGVGATFPYGRDPRDRNLRLAPTYPSLAELKLTMEILCCCVKLAAAEKLLGDKAAPPAAK